MDMRPDLDRKLRHRQPREVSPTFDALDDFAGPGGWDEGARMIGLTSLGFEWDQAACDTAEAAGHARVKIDVSLADAAVYRGKVRGYIGSPPCTLFSSAGSGVGNLVIDALAAGIVRLFAGDDCRAEVREQIYPVTLAEAEKKNAKREPAKKWPQEKVKAKARQDAFVASLVLEPARRIMELDPEWIALEQVPEVLPLWQVYVRELRALGYSAWTGVLNAANYGVPQTRERAALMASRVRRVAPPVPTHSQHGDDGDLFGTSRKTWVSMAQALGWKRPAILRMTTMPNSAVRTTDQPAPTMAFGHDSASARWFVSAGVTGEGRPKDPETQPADTLTSKGTAYWITGQRRDSGLGAERDPRGVDEPSYTIRANGSGTAPSGVEWTSRQSPESSERVTVEQAGILQSFPADYPWQGPSTKRFQQVGNAVPPLLAAHVLAALTGVEMRAAA